MRMQVTIEESEEGKLCDRTPVFTANRPAWIPVPFIQPVVKRFGLEELDHPQESPLQTLEKGSLQHIHTG